MNAAADEVLMQTWVNVWLFQDSLICSRTPWLNELVTLFLFCFVYRYTGSTRRLYLRVLPGKQNPLLEQTYPSLPDRRGRRWQLCPAGTRRGSTRWWERDEPWVTQTTTILTAVAIIIIIIIIIITGSSNINSVSTMLGELQQITAHSGKTPRNLIWSWTESGTNEWMYEIKQCCSQVNLKKNNLFTYCDRIYS